MSLIKVGEMRKEGVWPTTFIGRAEQCHVMWRSTEALGPRKLSLADNKTIGCLCQQKGTGEAC